MAYRADYKDEMDKAIWLRLPRSTKRMRDGLFRDAEIKEMASVLDISNEGFRMGTVRNSLKRLLDEGQAVRAWDGNERYGRWVYARIEG